MILDAHNQFSDSQAVTATAASDNLIDLGAIRNVGVGQPLYLIVMCTVAMTDSGSDSTVAVTIETDDNASFSSATTAQTIGTFSATSAAGTKLVALIQPNAVNERYMRLKYTVAGGNLTTGSFDAYLAESIDAFTAYADAITIS